MIENRLLEWGIPLFKCTEFVCLETHRQTSMSMNPSWNGYLDFCPSPCDPVSTTWHSLTLTSGLRSGGVVHAKLLAQWERQSNPGAQEGTLSLSSPEYGVRTSLIPYPQHCRTTVTPPASCNQTVSARRCQRKAILRVECGTRGRV